MLGTAPGPNPSGPFELRSPCHRAARIEREFLTAPKFGPCLDTAGARLEGRGATIEETRRLAKKPGSCGSNSWYRTCLTRTGYTG